MEDKPARSVHRVCQYLLRQSIRLYPPEQRFWGQAAAAEAQAMASQFGMVRWTWGALWVAVRAGLARLLARPSDFLLGGDSFLRLSWRSLSPLVLALSLSLFLVPQFRQALRATTSLWIAGEPDPGLSPRSFHTLQAVAERNQDAPTLAFLAMRSSDPETGLRLAEKAIALDPGLTWILAELQLGPPSSRVEPLLRWDPDNALPYLRYADFLAWSAQVSEKKDQYPVLEELRGGKTEYRELLKRAFAAPRYDSYLDRRLRLDREVMRRHGLAEPLLLLEGLHAHRMWSVYGVRSYAEWIIAEAKSASGGSDKQTVADACRQVLRFGERLETQSSVDLERLVGTALQQVAAKELVPILRQQGKAEEAETLTHMLLSSKQAQQRDINLQVALLDPRSTPNYVLNVFNPGIVIHVAALVFILTFGLLAASVLYLRWRRAEGEALALPWMISYAPFLLLASALVLLITYMPYARVFDMYMVNREMVHGKIFPPMNDPQLLSYLSNLQYPLTFLRGPDIWHTLWTAFAVMLATAGYSFWRMRVSPARV